VANEIIAVGMTCYDHVVVVPSLRGVENGCRVIDVISQGGGVAATAAVAARSLGVRTQLWVRVGEDGQGEFIIDDLRKRGIDTSHIQVVEGARTPISTVLVEATSGERRFLYFAGRSLDTRWDPPEYDRIARARALIVDGRWPGVCLARASPACRSSPISATAVKRRWEYSD
jgi:sulfofructose kinase